MKVCPSASGYNKVSPIEVSPNAAHSVKGRLEDRDNEERMRNNLPDSMRSQ